MKLNILIAVVIGVFAYGVTVYLNQKSTPNIIIQPESTSLIQEEKGQKAPDFKFVDLDGKKRMLSDFKGKIVILNFWASWCAPCIKEFPILIRLVQQRDDVVLIAMSSDFDLESMNRFVKKQKGLEHPRIFVALDSDMSVTRKLYQTYKLPETYIIAPQQTIEHKLIGADWKEEDVLKRLEDLSQRR